MSDREYYFITDQDGDYLCSLEGGKIGWSKHVIDAVDFELEEDANKSVAALIALGIFFCGVSWRSGPPQDFLYTNPHLPPKEERVRRNDETHEDYARRLGLLFP